MIRKLAAVQFVRFMESGRTSPALFGCEDESGRMIGEYVLKLRGTVSQAGLVKEMFASGLASHFGLVSPEPALIGIERNLADLITRMFPTHAAVIAASVGLNFGTRALTGVSTWPVDKSLPFAMFQAATNIFAFDALIQNPDRRYCNPNLFAKGDSLVIFDHEMAFSFLLALFPSAPWSLDDQQYLSEHVFFRTLKSKGVDLTAFTASLAGLTDGVLAEFLADVPGEWRDDSLPKIKEHLCAIRDHVAEFAEAVRRFLA